MPDNKFINIIEGRQLSRRILQYAAGLLCMALGAVILKRTDWGVSPITAVPDAVANITVLTIGQATIILHALCVIGQVIVQKKITLKSILCLGVGVPFGYLVDFFMWLWNPGLVLWQKIVSLVLGIAVQGLGVALVSGCDMMLPAPDELNNVIARTYSKKLWNVKMCADAVYVITAVIINLAAQGSLASVGICSAASVLLTGKFVQLTFRLLPGIRMTPFFGAVKKEKAHEGHY